MRSIRASGPSRPFAPSALGLLLFLVAVAKHRKFAELLPGDMESQEVGGGEGEQGQDIDSALPGCDGFGPIASPDPVRHIHTFSPAAFGPLSSALAPPLARLVSAAPSPCMPLLCLARPKRLQGLPAATTCGMSSATFASLPTHPLHSGIFRFSSSPSDAMAQWSVQ
jgi:hypothetical protein